MANPIKYIKCLFKRHKIDTKENILDDGVIDPNNWICPCHRCGFYIQHNTITKGISSHTKRGALKIRQNLIEYMGEYYSPQAITQLRKEFF